MKQLIFYIVLFSFCRNANAQLTAAQTAALVYKSVDSTRKENKILAYKTADSVRKEIKILAFKTADSVRKESKAYTYRTADTLRKEFAKLIAQRDSTYTTWNKGQSDSLLTLFTRLLTVDTTSLTITADGRLAINPSLFTDIHGKLKTYQDLFLQYYQVDSILNDKINILGTGLNALQKNNSPTRDEFNIEKSFLDKLRSGSTSVQIKPL